MKQEHEKLIPLAPAALHILLALAAEDRHGYAIMKEVARQSEGSYKLGPATLFYNLQRLVDQGLVREMGQKASDTDSRRRYYRLNAAGRGVLAAEVKRLEGVVREAQIRLQEPNPRRT